MLEIVAITADEILRRLGHEEGLRQMSTAQLRGILVDAAKSALGSPPSRFSWKAAVWRVFSNRCDRTEIGFVRTSTI